MCYTVCIKFWPGTGKWPTPVRTCPTRMSAICNTIHAYTGISKSTQIRTADNNLCSYFYETTSYNYHFKVMYTYKNTFLVLELHIRFYKVFDRRQTMHATKHGNSALFACRITVWNDAVSYLTLTTSFETYNFQWCSLIRHLRALSHNLLIKGRDIFRWKKIGTSI